MKFSLDYCIRYISFLKDFLNFREKASGAINRFHLLWCERYPCLYDKVVKTNIDRHYVYHTAWAARVLSKTNPVSHIDISSFIYFSTIASAFIPVKFYDYRPIDLKLSNLTSGFADLLSLPFENRSIQSLSCMHVIEHIGLGRYGDQLDPEGDLKAITELKRVLGFNGNLLFVVPIGKPKIMFNAHRIYSYDQILSYFNDFRLEEFALISCSNKDNGIIRNATKLLADSQMYGCGCFWFKKIK